MNRRSIQLYTQTHIGGYSSTIDWYLYGLASSPGIFQRIMCSLLGKIPNVEIFLDDLMIFWMNKIEHIKALERVFDTLHKNGLKLKANKCEFFVNETKYLGFIISKEGIKTDPSKVEAITKIPRPSNITQLRSFFGFDQFLREICEKYEF